MGGDLRWKLGAENGKCAPSMDTLPDFLQPLRFLRAPFPREAIEEAKTRWEEAVPHLLASLEALTADPGSIDEEPYNELGYYAYHLLAEMKEKRALPVIIALFCSLAGDELFEDQATDSLHQVLAAICHGQVEPIKSLAADDGQDDWVRSAALTCFGVLYHNGQCSRAELSKVVKEAASSWFERTASPMWDSLVMLCGDFALTEHRQMVKDAYQKNWVCGMADPLKQCLKNLDREPGAPAPFPEREYAIDIDTIDEMENWACFLDLEEDEEFESHEPIAPVVRETPKIGRNEDCPCGSGKKYKKCCGKAA